MSIEMSERPLSAEERRRWSAWAGGRSDGMLGSLAHWGKYLVLVPIGGGGLVGGFLDGVLRLGEALSFGIGFTLGAIVSVVVYRWDREAERLRQQHAGTATNADSAVVVRFRPIRAWEIEGLGDFGPGYLFEVAADDPLVYVAHQMFLDLDEVPGREITVEHLPVVDELLDVRCAGGRLSVEPTRLAVEDIPFERGGGMIPFATLPRTGFDATVRWRAGF